MANRLKQWVKTGIKHHKEYLLMLVLCYFAFTIVSATGGQVFLNAILIMELEFIVIVFYLLILRELPPFLRIIKENSLASFLLLLWLLSITFSLFFSPLEKSSEYYVQQRYFQTVTHVIFFIFIWDFLNRYNPPLKWLILTIAASSLYVMGCFLLDWISGVGLDENTWLNSPPLNSNIRHTGYQVEAAIAFFLSMIVLKNTIKLKSLVTIMVWVILWAFLFWMGGRGSAIAIIGGMFAVWVGLYLKGSNSTQFGFLMAFVIIAAIVISESASVFPWNGMFAGVLKSIQADSLSEVSANRTIMWETTWESVKGSIFFGFGPQGYVFMPNRYGGYVHPHNIFLQFLVEWGAVGTSLFLYLLIRTFVKGIKLQVMNKLDTYNLFALSAGAVILSLSAHSLIDGTYYHPQPSVYLAIAYAIWIVPWHKKKMEE